MAAVRAAAVYQHGVQPEQVAFAAVGAVGLVLSIVNVQIEHLRKLVSVVNLEQNKCAEITSDTC